MSSFPRETRPATRSISNGIKTETRVSLSFYMYMLYSCRNFYT